MLQLSITITMIYRYYMGVSLNGGTPQNGWFRMEDPMKMDDNWGYP